MAFGAKDAQTVNALLEAESFDGPSLVLAYSHCIAHGYDLAQGLAQQKKAVETGYWPLFRHDPRRAAPGQSPLKLDSAAPKGRLVDPLIYLFNRAPELFFIVLAERIKKPGGFVDGVLQGCVQHL